MTMKQRSTEWRNLRLGDVTASRFRDVLTEPRTKAAREAGQWSQSAESYCDELLSELVHCRPADTWRSDATDWGREQEPFAFERAVKRIRQTFDNEVLLPEGEYAYIHHHSEPCIGCSPDGIVGDHGLLEIKCPYNGAKWIAAHRHGLELPREHIAQVQGSLWCTGRQWYNYCWFDPRVEASGLDPLLLIVVKRDDEYIDGQLAPRVIAFRDYVRSEYEKLVGKGPF